MKKVLFNQPAYKEKVDLKAGKPLKWFRSRSVLLYVDSTTSQLMRVECLIPANKPGDMWFYRKDEIMNMMLIYKIENKPLIFNLCRHQNF